MGNEVELFQGGEGGGEGIKGQEAFAFVMTSVAHLEVVFILNSDFLGMLGSSFLGKLVGY